MGARLIGGLLSASTRDDFAGIRTRLLSPEGLGKRLLLFDNLKTLRLSSEDLEQLVTAEVVSGRCLYVGEAQRPNTLTVVLTINGASLSKDLAQRTVPITLARPTYTPSWESDVQALVERDRWAIIGDLVAILRRPAAPLAACGRWGTWEREVLGRLADPPGLQRLIAGRQAAIDADEDESGVVRDAIAGALERHGYDPAGGPWFVPTTDLVGVSSRPSSTRSWRRTRCRPG